MYLTKKRIVLCLDGTGQDALIATDDGKAYGDGQALYFTNVLRLSRAVNTFAPDPSKEGGTAIQIVFYQSGVGTDSDFKGHASTAELALELYGTAVARKIRDAYAFIAQNYTPGDEIFLFGFSRGAYTARKVAGLINRIGLLPIKDMGRFYAYCYTLETGKGDPPPWPTQPVPIQVLGVWDTVGALRTGIMQDFPGMVDALSISDSELPPNVKLALHALAFHENRNWFQLTLFTVPPEEKQTPREKEIRKGLGQVLKQVWFGGEHSDVGGGWSAHELADIALMWMASEVAPHLSLDNEQLLDALRPHPDKPAWGESVPHNSYMAVPAALAIVGGIEPSTRLDGGHLTRDSLFHESFLMSPRPTPDDVKKREEDEESEDDNVGQAGKAKSELKVNIVKAMGKHMITLDDLKKHFGEDWEPQVVPLNPLEKKAREVWKTMRKASASEATYESRKQAVDVFNDNPEEAKKAGKN
ncbi:hypothetical protein EXIGLDRAFT_722945 [Exidia glandulosa HHB12029]|uniref:T6SS Phospholipase effector Tle1-like catalytic domain-containing protein n=1 Tax=Exidia glandulosa HHB12029 TaxID=1314781 RepID=A0A165F1J1_EXIGL|nr:hypothetical protein EXIGLDRAFT_722945 [Exidia glandulosa HHB12029]